MIYNYDNYRKFLKDALTEKASQSPGYSLRAFAEKVQVSNSFLSEVLNSKKSLSVEVAFKIALRLDLTEKESQYFCLLVQLEQEKDAGFREAISKRLTAINSSRPAYDLSVDLFKIISDWYHLSILELTFLTGLKLSPSTISERLGISKVEAALALERLERLELIEKTEKGGYRKTKGYLLSESPIPNEALKQYHRQILEKAMIALQTHSPKERISATDVFALDSECLPEADRLSQEFSSAMFRLSEKSKIKDNVYALSVHLFSVTHLKRRKP